MLVEKEQVALLAAEAVAFLDKIADEYPELPFDIPSTQSVLREPTVPLFRARLIGLGFDPERELVLLELRERAEDGATNRSEVVEVAEDDDGYVARIYATRAQVRAMAARGIGSRRRWAPAVPALRAADGPLRAPLSSLELTPEELRAALEARRARGRRPHALLVERDVPRRGEGRRRWSWPRSTSPGAVSVRCGTSRRARSASGRWRPTSCPHALGWDIVPLTILRDGPLGVGAVQRFVDHDPDEHFFTLRDEHEDRFREFAWYDVLVNNTDRKGGHCLHDQVNDLIVGIDHGLTFHEDWKLRTVIWDFAGERLPGSAADDVCRVVADLESGPLGERMAGLLDDDEVDAVLRRAQGLLSRGLPLPDDWHSTPWPLV